MGELLLLISGGIAVGITLRLVCVLLGATVRFIDSCVRAT
jgi:hypothetical protein